MRFSLIDGGGHMKADELKLEQFYKISSPFNQKDPQERLVSIPAAAIGLLRT